jgi:hypothetical protein
LIADGQAPEYIFNRIEVAFLRFDFRQSAKSGIPPLVAFTA